MFDSRLGTDPYRADSDEFESDVLRLVEQWEEDLGMVVDVDRGAGWPSVEVLGIVRNGEHLTVHTGRRLEFDTVAEFRKFVEQYAPEDYR